MRVSNNQLVNVPFNMAGPVSTGRQNRLMVMIQNRSAGNIYLSFGTPPSNLNGVFDGIEIPPNGTFVIDQYCPREPIYLKPDSIGGSIAQILEVYGDE